MTMIFPLFLVLLLSFVAVAAILVVYICLLWYSVTNGGRLPPATQSAAKEGRSRGLSADQLSQLPSMAMAAAAAEGAECAVCLDEIVAGQPTRVVPGCNHGFHAECADTWLSMRPVCPVCRAVLLPELFRSVDPSPC